MPAAVQSNLCNDERAIFGDVLEPREIGAETLLRFEINVKTNEVQKRKLQVFRSRIVDVRNERSGVFRLDGPKEPLDELLDSPSPMPPNDTCRNLISHRIAQDRRMLRDALDGRAHVTLDPSRTHSVVKESDVLLPTHTNHDAQPVTICGIEQPEWRHRIGSDGV
jgi:hypothetical protein